MQAENKAAGEARHIAWTSLSTICAIVIDIARLAGPSTAGALPLCCYYNMVEGLEHMRERNALERTDQLSADIDTLTQCAAMYRSSCSL